jgi:hypothetical protein
MDHTADTARHHQTAGNTTHEELVKFFNNSSELTALLLKKLLQAALDKRAQNAADLGIQFAQGDRTIFDNDTNDVNFEDLELLQRVKSAKVGDRVEGAEGMDLKLYGRKLLQVNANGMVEINYFDSPEYKKDAKAQQMWADFDRTLKEQAQMYRVEPKVGISPESAEIDAIDVEVVKDDPEAIDVPAVEVDPDAIDVEVLDHEIDVEPDVEVKSAEFQEIDPLTVDANFNPIDADSVGVSAAEIATEALELGDLDTDFNDVVVGAVATAATVAVAAVVPAGMVGVVVPVATSVAAAVATTAISTATSFAVPPDYAEDEYEYADVDRFLDAEESATVIRSPQTASGLDMTIGALSQIENPPVEVQNLIGTLAHIKANPTVLTAAEKGVAIDHLSNSGSLPISGNLEPNSQILTKNADTMAATSEVVRSLIPPGANKLLTEQYSIERTEEAALGISTYNVYDSRQPEAPILTYSESPLGVSLNDRGNPVQLAKFQTDVVEAQQAIRDRQANLGSLHPVEPETVQRYQNLTIVALDIDGFKFSEGIAESGFVVTDSSNSLEVARGDSGAVAVKDLNSGQQVLTINADGGVGINNLTGNQASVVKELLAEYREGKAVEADRTADTQAVVKKPSAMAQYAGGMQKSEPPEQKLGRG